MFCLLTLLLLVSCSTKKNTSQTRWWHSFNARYNTYFNGSQAFIDGSLEKENGNKDNHTELIPLYTVTNKNSRELGKGNFDRAVEKSEKVIKLHSIKKRPEWKKNRRKTQKDIEWLNRREYNPFLWHAWLLLGKSQFQQGQFEEAAATFSYMSRLYQTQRAIHDIARAWQAKSYTELGWLYDAEDVITKQRRDTIHYRARQDWDYTHANFYVRSGRYEEAIPYLQQVIKHERRRKQKAREWYLLGQLQTALNRKQDAYNSYGHVIRLNPPYELEFNARISQTEVMPATDSKHKISKLRRMARSDKNKEYLDQVYYAIGNVYLTQRDTLHAIEAYEEGNEKATRSGIEKGVLLLTLGNLYWDKEKYGDARRCYGEAIGLLDKDRKDYQQLANRSKVLDELVPHTDAVELQDSLQRLAKMPEAERNKIIDKVIEDLIKKEKEEKRKQEEAEAEKKLQQEEAKNGSLSPRTPTTPTMPGSNQSGLWYFYNPQAVSQGKQTFQRQWGKRQNQDNWQRINQTVVNLTPEVPEGSEAPEGSETPEGSEGSEALADSTATETPDSAALDPHKREYYLAQIPFTEDQLADSHNQIKDGLYHSGIIFKDKLDNLSLSRKALTRLINDYPDYEHNDEVLYHLFLLYSRQQLTAEADQCLAALQQDHPESDWTILLSDPNFMENQRFGTHIEDSVYAATYEAFKASRYEEVKANTNLSETRFPLGQHRPKFMFIEGLSLLNEGDDTGCAERLKRVVEQYPQSEVTELAGMILRGVQQGRKLQGGKFDIDDIWSRRSIELTADSTLRDTLRFERNVSYVFLLAYQPDSINQNQLLFELAKYNFSNYMVRNFDIQTDQDPNGLCRMLVSGFLSYDEAHQYARQLYSNEAMTALLRHCRSLIVSEPNLRLLGTSYSYRDYELFFEQQIAPVEVSPIPLLDEPESIIQAEEQEEATEEPSEENPSQPANSNAQPDDFILDAPQQQNNSGFPEFDDDFWR
ncbi:MAG: tetratricopeptide repeat protein [Prevotella sp.]|nr:tetratricopeptide repeat protein [Prevotella sp.]